MLVCCTWNRILTRSRGATQVFARHPATPPASNDLHTSESITAPPVCGMGAAAGPPALARRSSTIRPLKEAQVAAIRAQTSWYPAPFPSPATPHTVFICIAPACSILSARAGIKNKLMSQVDKQDKQGSKKGSKRIDLTTVDSVAKKGQEANAAGRLHRWTWSLTRLPRG